MPFFGAADIDAIIAATGGVDVTLGGTTVKGLLDITDSSVVQGQAADFMAETVSVTVKTGALTGLEEGAALVADGVAYIVQRVQRIDDGALTVAYIARS